MDEADVCLNPMPLSHRWMRTGHLGRLASGACHVLAFDPAAILGLMEQ
ncbi:hypothetical protein [Bradyrhizobium sp. CCBAU 51765]|nr:hypothetical protein [Bradyrhizobium sp. CCBAU 51765]